VHDFQMLFTIRRVVDETNPFLSVCFLNILHKTGYGLVEVV
jgi:hypothetical protein